MTAPLLALAVTLIFWLLHDLAPMQRLELTLLDRRYLDLSRHVKVSPRLALIEFDTRSEKAVGKHSTFWLDVWGRVCGSVLGAGARVVGLDVILTQTSSGLEEFVPVAVGAGGKLVTIASWDDGELVLPAPEVIASVGTENLALANLTRDFDGVVRRQSLAAMPLSALGRSSWPFLAALVYERQGGAVPAGGLVRFASRNPFPTYRLEDVLAMTPPQLHEAFADKCVLIGGVARSDQDIAETPFSLEVGPDGRRHSMPGLYVQAFVLNSLLTGQWIVPVPRWVDLLALFAANLLVAFAVMRGARAWLACLVVGLTVVTVGYVAFLQGWWLQLADILLALPLCVGLGYTVRVVWAERSRRSLERSIARFVAPEVLREMLADPAARRESLTTRRVVTVLFSDINDFSTVCEAESPEEVTRKLDDHYREMSHVIFRHRGTIIRFVGDQFMVLFGAPGPVQENPAARAMLCALDMIARLEEMSRSGKPGFYGLKIGIHTGEMLLATIGDEQKSEYTAVGDNANQGARIQDLAKKVGVPILVSQAVVDAAGAVPGVVCEDRGEFPVKGRHHEIRVYAVRREG